MILVERVAGEQNTFGTLKPNGVQAFLYKPEGANQPFVVASFHPIYIKPISTE